MRFPAENNRRHGGPAGTGNKRLTMSTIYSAINKKGRKDGATLREIQRYVNNNAGLNTTLKETKEAIQRAINKGAIRKPRGFRGFQRQMVVPKTADSKSYRSGNAGRGRGRPKKDLKHGKRKPGSNNNANQSDNYGTDEDENATKSLWSSYLPCNIQ